MTTRTLSFLFFIFLFWKNGCTSSFASPSTSPYALKILSSDQLASYEHRGLLILPSFISQETCAQLRQCAQQLIQTFDDSHISSLYREYRGEIPWEEYYWKSKSQLCFFFEKEAFLPDGTFKFHKEQAVKKISYALHVFIPEFRQFSNQLKVIDLLNDLGIQDPLFVQSMYLIKQPYIGSPITCHQDGSFLHSDPDTLITLWFALNDATMENGCLGVLPGGHIQPLKFKLIKDSQNHLSYEVYEDQPWALDQMIPLEVREGDLIIMHSHLPHLSYANRSSHPRHAYSLHIISRQSHFLPTNWLAIP